MDPECLQLELALAEARLDAGRGNIARQREAIAELERRGEDPGKAKDLLCMFERAQAMHMACRQRILQELAIRAARGGAGGTAVASDRTDGAIPARTR